MSALLSLSEIDALGRKAARGAGYEWGVAEEAGRTVRWLSAYGFQGLEALAHWLELRGHDTARHRPVLQGGVWRAGATLCPLTAGTLVSDREHELLSGRVLAFGAVQQPMLMLSMVARIIENRACAVVFSIDNVDIHCVAQGLFFPVISPWRRTASNVRCVLAEAETPPTDGMLVPSPRGRPVDVLALRQLQALASRTYAPATDASRLAGAGAGRSDND